MSRHEQHAALVAELLELFQQHAFTIIGVDGVPGFSTPKSLTNDGYGDQQPKAPDIHAFDSKAQRMVFGEAKTGDGDFETDHALTQYNVFLDQFDKRSGQQALVYIIVPGGKVAEFNTLITHYIHPEYWPSIVLVASQRIA